MKLDLLAIAAHPDDVELTCGGTEPANGRNTDRQAPVVVPSCPLAALARTCPRIAVTSSRTMARPSPEPVSRRSGCRRAT